MSEETWHDLLPSDEERKLLDPVAEKYTTQKLRILDEEESHTRIGKILDFFSPHFDELPSNFDNAVKEYRRLTLVVSKRISSYEQYPKNSDSVEAIEARDSLFQAVLSLREVTREFYRLYYQALAEHRVDEGLAQLVEELTRKNTELSTQYTKLESQATLLRNQLDDAEQEVERLSNLVRVLGGNPDRTLSGDLHGGDYRE
jgi:hypothetical protein